MLLDAELTLMNTLSINLKKTSKVKKKNAPKKKKGISVFGEDEDLNAPSFTKISVLEDFNKKEDASLTIKPADGLISNLKALHGATLNSSSYPIPNIALDTSKVKGREEIPDKTELEEYETIPIEEFGCALLRGMGWNGEYGDEEEKTSVQNGLPHETGRPELLGIGAKSIAKPNNLEDDFMPLMKVEKKI